MELSFVKKSKLAPKFGRRHVCAPTGKSQRGEQHSPMLMMMHYLLMHHCLLLSEPLLIILIAIYMLWIHGGILPLVWGWGRLIVGHGQKQKQAPLPLLQACFIYVYGHQVRNHSHPTRPSDGHVESYILLWYIQRLYTNILPGTLGMKTINSYSYFLVDFYARLNADTVGTSLC
jgi:hypothetical protein